MDGRCVEGFYVRIDTQMLKFEVVNRNEGRGLDLV
jgi:hypothetical protein